MAERDQVSESLVRKAVRAIARERAEIPSDPIVRFGCRPLVPYYGQPLYDPNRVDAAFHAPTILASEVGDHPWPTTDCPGCRGRVIASPVATCAWCSGLAPRFEHAVAAQRKATSVLTELERRRFWSNSAPGWLNREILGENRKIKGLILDIRTWLALEGQQPNYDLVLDRRGNILGRRDEGWTPPGGWSQRKSWMPLAPQTKRRAA